MACSTYPERSDWFMGGKKRRRYSQNFRPRLWFWYCWQSSLGCYAVDEKQRTECSVYF